MYKKADPLVTNQDNAGTVGGAVIGHTLGAQASNAIKDIMRAKGYSTAHPTKAALAGSAISVGSILGGIYAGQKASQKTKQFHELPDVVLVDRLPRKKKNDSL